MEKRKVVFSQKFNKSLREYVVYVQSNVSAEMADYVKKGILEKCRGLSNFSGFSKELYILDKLTEYQSVTKWNYLIIYTVKNNEIWILNIIHTSRNPKRRSEF